MTRKTHELPLTAGHWGVYRAEVVNNKLQALHPFEMDAAPSPIGQGYLGVLDDPLRIRAPMVRKSWLVDGPGAATERRGSDPFVQISWDEAERLVANELDRIRSEFGNEAIFGGSYGWSGAGRFHHAQSQLHRFLNCIGGYTRSVNSYSLAAGEVILSHILGDPAEVIHNPPSWRSVIDNTELLVAFGGMPLRNSQISSGGTGRHRARAALREAREAGVKLVNISPVRDDVAEELDADWIAPRPSTDVAIMLGIGFELLQNQWHDQSFLDRYTVGFQRFADYLQGRTDGIEKSAAWAAEIAEISAAEIRRLAKLMARSRTLISTSWSLTRQENGEQAFWMATVLAAMLGQIGLPGGGVAFGYGAANSVGVERRRMTYASLPQLKNPVESFIPVARISDMLLHPGAAFRYNGQERTYPSIKAVYWAGGNPFHHHQDLTRLCRAWEKPDTIIVNDWCWNALAKRADIVLPCTTQLERRDLMLSPRDPFIVLMEAVVEPAGEARDDFEIFRGLSRRLGVEKEFAADRCPEEWLRWLYEQSRELAKDDDVDLPAYEKLAEAGFHYVEPDETAGGTFAEFRADPDRAPLKTPSGKIEIYSETIASFGYRNVQAHPSWSPPKEWLGEPMREHPFHLISSQPPEKLHSQLDHGPVSRKAKIRGRAPVGLHPSDADRVGICEGDLVRVFNKRGACLASATLDASIRAGVVRMSTGAWLDPVLQEDGTLMCRHGNPNTLTRDQGTSELAQGPTAHSCLVTIEKYCGNDHDVFAFHPPEIETEKSRSE